MENKLNEIKYTLKKYDQEHLLNMYDKLSDEKKEELLDQIEKIDFELVKHLYNTTVL